MHITLFVILIFDSSKFNFDNLYYFMQLSKYSTKMQKHFGMPHSQQRTHWALPPLSQSDEAILPYPF